MKSKLRSACAVLVPALLCLLPARAAPPARPAPQLSNCFAIFQIPCGECPGQRSKYCTADPSGPFQSCVESSAYCSGTSACHEVTTTTGGGCDS